MCPAFLKTSAPKSKRATLSVYPFLAVIWLHRLILAPFITVLLGSTCRFHPSCSHYAEDALRRYGALRGSIMAVKRVLRCHPWHEGGYDPVV